MTTGWKWKTSIALFFVLLSVWFVLPNFVDLPEVKEGEPSPWYVQALPKSRLRLGLDLQGGIHMVLGIDLNRALMNEMDRYAQDLKELLPSKEIALESVERPFDSTQILLKVKSASDSKKLEDYLGENFSVLSVVEKDTPGGTYRLEMDSERQTDVERMTVEQALETLRGRLDEFGVAEPSIQAQGKDRIIVQLPGMADPERAKNVLGRTARLEFRLVDEESMDGVRLETLVQEAKKKLPEKFKAEDLNRLVHDQLPAGTEVLLGEQEDPTQKNALTHPYLVKTGTVLTGDMLEDARVSVGEMNAPIVSFRFNARGAELLDKLTGDNVGKQLAIILDDIVQSAPVIRTRLTDGRGQIELGALKPRNEIMDEAKDLALILRAGALPAPVEVLQNRAVGPSLGRDSIESGLRAFLVGALLVICFMAVYYRLSGVMADFAVVVNVLFTLAALCAMNATLTLPGIAGILISVGMAVDANVLIFERIREELRAGKTVKAAIEAGYDRAHITILDSNLTTIITGVVLLQYGSGPVKGFAVTLILGLIGNYFTALWYTRLGYDWIVARFMPKRLSI